MEAKKPNLLVSLGIAIAVLVVIGGVSVGLGAIGIPAWPFIFFLFAITTLSKLTKDGWLDTFIGGLIGLLVGLSSVIFGYFFGPTVGLIALLVLVIILITLLVSGKFKYINVVCLFVLTAVSSFTAFIPPEQIVPVLISFGIGAAVFGLVVLLMSKGKKKA